MSTFDKEAFENCILAKSEEYDAIPKTTAGGVSIYSPQHVPEEWDRLINDCLFQITGFSDFFGTLAFQCQYYWMPLSEGYTAKAGICDGKFYVFLSPAFMVDWLQSFGHRTFVLVHEIYHIFFEHGDRGIEAGYENEDWGQAIDYFVNLDIVKIHEESKSIHIDPPTKSVFPMLFDRKYDGYTEDEIYKEIHEEQDEEDEPEKGDGEPENSDDDQEGDGDEGDDDSDSGDGDGMDNSSDGAGSGNPVAGKGRNGQYPLDAPPKSVTTGEASSTTNSQQVAEAVNMAAARALQSNHEMGSAQAAMIRRFQEACQPSTDWESEIADYFQSICDERLTYATYNRRSSDDVVFPSKEGDFIRVFWGNDTSGSMGQDDLDEAATELQALLDQIDCWEVSVASCDVGANVVYELSFEEEDRLDQVDIELLGGGGTELSPLIYEAMRLQDEEDIEYDVIIIMTDGYVPEEPLRAAIEACDIPVIFLITSDGKVLSDDFRCIQIN